MNSHLSVNINDNYILPPEIVCEILQRADFSLSLQYVCKGFAAHFFEAFWQGCANSPSLTDRVHLIELDHPKFSAMQKIRSLYMYLRQEVKQTQGKPASQEDMLKLACASIKELHQLDSWLEDISLFTFFGRLVPSKLPDAEDWLATLKEKSTSEKLQEIRQWFFSNEKRLKTITELNLYNFKLVKLPKEIGLFSQLQELLLLDNKLTKLPKQILSLNQLKVLRLHNNQFTNLPEAIASLSQLQELDISCNKLTSLPEWMSGLKHLKELYIEYNQLTSLPAWIAKFNQLEKLSLHNNQLTSLPQEIDSLNQLKDLDLAHNQLLSLPPEIGNLKQLTGLNLSHNQLKRLPQEICQLNQLQNCYLGYNPFKVLPEQLDNLIQLGVVSLNC